MGNFAENLNLGNRFRPPPPYMRQHKSYMSVHTPYDSVPLSWTYPLGKPDVRVRCYVVWSELQQTNKQTNKQTDKTKQNKLNL